MENGVEEARADLREILDQSEAWLRKAAAAPSASPEWTGGLEQDADMIRRIRTRTASTLINVALLGAFSSGKSFLLSGLQGALELITVPSEDGMPQDKFLGLLPSSPVPTNACPASVVPVDGESQFDASGTGFLRVRFTDSDEWEDVGNSPAPSVVAAYVMHNANIADRFRAHRGRKVAEIEILLDNYQIPAKFYDLPGHSSPNPIHDEIVKTAMLDADCFIYVCHASRSLAESDLDLIRFLYSHYLKSRKRVVWVVTAVDLATQLDHRNIPAWQATIVMNNSYLEENFTVNGQPDTGFIGEGFIPASPASEARATLLAAEGADAAARRYVAESRMPALRRTLEDLISEEAGRRHIAKAAGEARSVLAPRSRALAERLQEERLPIDELADLLTSQRERLEKLNSAIPRIREELEKALQGYIKRSARPFTKLAAHLHSTLDSMIHATDVRNATKANRVQVAKTQALASWMDEPNGPASLWENQLPRFQRDMLRAVNSHLSDSDIAGPLSSYSFDMNDLIIPRPQSRRHTTQDYIQRTAALIGLSAPVVAAGSWMVGAAGLAIPPASVVMGVSALVFMAIQYRKSKSTLLEVEQQAWISALDAEAKEIQRQFELAVGLKGMTMVDDLVENLNQYREQLEDAVERTRERIAQPETQDRQELVSQLKPLTETGETLTSALRALATL